MNDSYKRICKRGLIRKGEHMNITDINAADIHMNALFYMLSGYLSGSVLYARLIARMLKKGDILEKSKDGNPGTANAFLYGGFLCGLLTLAGDLLKGFLPVYLFVHAQPVIPFGFQLALVMAAPMLGHAFPLFYRFHGGKGIAVSFGCLLGLFPFLTPALILAAYFLFFSLILQISPHFIRTLVTYLCSAVTLFLYLGFQDIVLGFLLMTGILCLRMHISKEKREKAKVRLLWMH